MRTSSPLCCVAVAVSCALALSCGDDDPVANDSPCDDANATCYNLELTTDRFQYSSQYDSGDDFTQHAIYWDFDDQAISNYGPGQHVTINLEFDPPLMVQYDHEFETFTLTFGALSGCFDRFAVPTTNFNATGWTGLSPHIQLMGECGTGASRILGDAVFMEFDAGDRLHRIAIDFTVPNTYGLGASAGTAVLAGDVTPLRVMFETTTDGDTEGDPPVWLGDFDDVPAALTPKSPSAR